MLMRAFPRIIFALGLLEAVVCRIYPAGPDAHSSIISLNRGWLFGGEYVPGSEDPGFNDTSFQEVTTPHVVTPLGWNKWDNNTWNKIWIYRRHFDLPRDTLDGSARIFVDFEGALTVATPSINGIALPSHKGGYLPFSYEITDKVNQTDNVLSVTLDARWSYVNPEGAPSGPESIDYLEPAGVNRDVTLRIVPSSFISDVFAKPVDVLKPSRHVVVECTVDSAKGTGQIQINSQLHYGGRTLSQASKNWSISRSGNETVMLNVPAPEVQLWSPDSPTLYQMVNSLIVGGHVVHSFTRNIGFREASFTTDGFFLNGNRTKIFGLNRHQIYPYVGMSASERLQKRDAELLKELNCNMVRCSHYPQSSYFLDMCDRLGIMVWEEVPGWQFIGNASWKEHVVSDIHDMIVRDRNRPSIIVWGVQVNESPLEPELYTETKNLAKRLDDSRQSSGTETSQTMANWVAEVFSYDDYHSKNGSAHLLPPLTTVPYLVSESVGGLDGPHYFRWFDSQRIQQDQARLHAQVHDIAGGNGHYSGLLGWVAIDYASLNGVVYENLKRTGVMDSFRIYKPGAAFYLTQGDASKNARIEPAFYWDFSPASPVTTLGRNATIWSNCDSVEAYVDSVHYATLSPDTVNFPHTAHPPFYLDTTNVNPQGLPELRLDGYVAGKKVATRTFSGNSGGDNIQLTADDHRLEADGIDTLLVTFRAVDKFGNLRPYTTGNVQLSISGPGYWVGDFGADNGTFSFTENGGVGGTILRAVAGKSGTIVIKASHPILGEDTVEIQAV